MRPTIAPPAGAARSRPLSQFEPHSCHLEGVARMQRRTLRRDRRAIDARRLVALDRDQPRAVGRLAHDGHLDSDAAHRQLIVGKRYRTTGAWSR